MYNLAPGLQCLVFIDGEILVPPNISDKSTTAQSPKLLDQVRDKLRVKHYSIRTETQYVQWIRRFILIHGKQHPKEMGAAEALLTHHAHS